ncbi:hypothetical protein ACLOJK_017895 [Asimina triloba]
MGPPGLLLLHVCCPLRLSLSSVAAGVNGIGWELLLMMVMECREDYASSPSGSEVSCRIEMLLAVENWMGSILSIIRRCRSAADEDGSMRTHWKRRWVAVVVSWVWLRLLDGLPVVDSCCYCCCRRRRRRGQRAHRYCCRIWPEMGKMLPCAVESKSTVGELAVEFFWIWLIGVESKNRASTMPPSDSRGMSIGTGEDDVRVARERMQPTLHVVAVVGGLLSRQIYNRVVMAKLMGGSDRVDGCSLMVGSPELRKTPLLPPGQ